MTLPLVVECMSKNNECRAIEVIGQDWSSEVVALLIEDCELIATWTNLTSRDRLVQFHWHTFSSHNELNQGRNPEILGDTWNCVISKAESYSC